MGWTCQHDANGYCKLLKTPCVPGIKGCILKKSEYIFTTGSYEEDKVHPKGIRSTANGKAREGTLGYKKRADEKQEQIDFAALARSN